MSDFAYNNIIDWLFIMRLFPLILAGFVATRGRDFVGVTIAMLYLGVTTVNYMFANPALNAVFSTPLVFLTSWYIIKPDIRNRRNRHIKIGKKIKLVKEK